MLPTFIIAGAPRSGTTSLYQYCREHPEVFMSPIKETNFFSGDPRGLTRSGYEALFAEGGHARARGEASPSYLRHPGAARRIRAAIPACRIVIILRNPVDRFLSGWGNSRNHGYNHTRLQAVLDAALAGVDRGATFSGVSLLEKGLYAEQVERYLRTFGSEQVLVGLYDELRADPEGLMTRVYAHIGVEPSFRPDVTTVHNGHAAPASPVLAGYLARPKPRLRRLVAPIVPAPVRAQLKRTLLSLNRRPSENRLQADERAMARQRLGRYYDRDIRRLEALIGRDLTAWLNT